MIEIKYPLNDGYVYIRFDDNGGMITRKAHGDDLKAHTVSFIQAYVIENTLIRDK